MSYDDHLLTEIAVTEAKKYKSGNYLDREYNLTNLISQSAFPTVGYPTYNTATYPQNTSSFIQPVAPTNTLLNIFD